MKDELQDELFRKYPKIFKQKDLPMQETCMCWGICTGDGWFGLLDQLCGDIQAHIDEGGGNIPQVEAIQVKEKFGTLRFYAQGGDEIIRNLIFKAMVRSGCVCEICGSTENVSTNNEGWMNTLCRRCREQRGDL